MPFLKRKPLPPYEFEDKEYLACDKNKIFKIRFTEEIFKDYNDYIQRFRLYRERVWSCAITGKTNLTYEEALLSEKKAQEGFDKFPLIYQQVALPIIHHNTLELKALVDVLHEHFRINYIPGETVDAEIEGNTYSVKVLELDQEETQKLRNKDPIDDQMDIDILEEFKGKKKTLEAENANNETEPSDNEEKKVKIEPKVLSCYKVEVLSAPTKRDPKISQVFSVAHSNLSRKKRGSGLSKETLRRYIKDSTTRDTYSGSPWMVKSAEDFGLATTLPDDLKKRKEIYDRNHPVDKRIKIEKNGEKEETQEPPLPPVKIRYPIEDSLVIPFKNETPLPPPCQDFLVPQKFVADLLMIWTFLQTFGRILNLYPFPLDEFESALVHSGLDCQLFNEVHYSMVILLLGNKTRKRGRDRDRERDKDREEAEDDDLIYQEWNGGEITMTNWPQALIFIVRKIEFRMLLSEERCNELDIELQQNKGNYLSLPISTKLIILDNLCHFLLRSSTPLKAFMEESHAEGLELNREKMYLEKDIKNMFEERDNKEKEKQSNENGNENGNGKSHEKNDDSEHSDASDNSDNESIDSDYQSSVLTDTENDSKFSEYDSDTSLNLSRSEKLKHKRAQQENEEKKHRTLREQMIEENKKKYQEIRASLLEKKEFERELTTKQRRLAQINADLPRVQIHRMRPLGYDRDWNRYYFFDNTGAAATLPVSYYSGTGKLFFNNVKDDSWGYFSNTQQLDQIIKHLNVKGERERALKKSLQASYDRIEAMMKKREKEQASAIKQDETRRSTRVKTATKRQPFMQYTNKWGT